MSWFPCSCLTHAFSLYRRREEERQYAQQQAQTLAAQQQAEALAAQQAASQQYRATLYHSHQQPPQQQKYERGPVYAPPTEPPLQDNGEDLDNLLALCLGNEWSYPPAKANKLDAQNALLALFVLRIYAYCASEWNRLSSL